MLRIMATRDLKAHSSSRGCGRKDLFVGWSPLLVIPLWGCCPTVCVVREREMRAKSCLAWSWTGICTSGSQGLRHQQGGPHELTAGGGVGVVVASAATSLAASVRAAWAHALDRPSPASQAEKQSMSQSDGTTRTQTQTNARAFSIAHTSTPTPKFHTSRTRVPVPSCMQCALIASHGGRHTGL